MKTANQITLARLGMAFVLPFFLLSDLSFGKTAALVIFGAAALTDFWDGLIARRSGTITLFGRLMDPVADKVLICSAFICFAAQDQIVPAWIVIVIMAREFMVTGIRLLAASQGMTVVPGRWGKHKTLWQIVVIIVIILGEAVRDDLLPVINSGGGNLEFDLAAFNQYFNPLIFWIVVMVAVLTVISGTIYLWQYRKLVMKDA
ncbi:MAG: CDP-diacylglycerol--glycerol-3-phosphate 3-phosphatidyltransferase [Kiritimatiellae bacterium]|nr:CDP-diacylglycerol--glycerol-3-phosphate 3-phosphatidyltransferase [Kiritimatiellia bacterium]